MSTVAVIAIVVGALVLLAILFAVMRGSARKRQLAQVQTEAQRDDARHHRERADERRRDAELAEEQAKRARAEAELDESRAASRERELNGDRPPERAEQERTG